MSPARQLLPHAVAGALLVGPALVAAPALPAAAAPADGTEPRPAVDVVVMVGQSAAMGDVQPLVRDALSELRDRVAVQGLDVRVGVGAYGGAGAAQAPVLLVPPTASVAEAAAAFGRLVADGGQDRTLEAFTHAMNRGLTEDGTGLCVVAVNDAPADENAPGFDDMPALTYYTGAHLFPVVSEDTEWGFYEISAQASGGTMHAVDTLRDAPAGVLGAIGDTCAQATWQRPSVSVSVDDGLTEARPGQEVTVRAVARNDGRAAASGPLTVTLPNGVTEARAEGGNRAAGVEPAAFTWNLMLAAGEQFTATVTYVVPAALPAGSALQAHAAVAPHGHELVPADNRATDATLVADAPSAPAGHWYLTGGLSGDPRGGEAFTFGPEGAEPFLGDWDGDGVDTPGYRVGNTFHLGNAVAGGAPEVSFSFGQAGDEALIGDWDGDGADSVGVRRGNQFFLTDSLDGGPHDVMFWYGRPGEDVLVGDWDGNGTDTLTIRRSNQFHVANTLKSGGADVVYWYGRPGEDVLVGDWDGDGADTVAIRRGTQVHVRNTLTTGNATSVTNFGRGDDLVLVGDIDGDGRDTLGVHAGPPAR